MPTVKIKRVYDSPSKSDGLRVLVDRLWPRGIKKADLKYDLWVKDVAPSTTLRKWFAHDVEKWREFKVRYTKELKGNASFKELKDLARKRKLTLLYAAKDPNCNHALVLQEKLNKSQRSPS